MGWAGSMGLAVAPGNISNPGFRIQVWTPAWDSLFKSLAKAISETYLKTPSLGGKRGDRHCAGWLGYS